MTTIIFLSFFWKYWKSNSSLPLHHQLCREKRLISVLDGLWVAMIPCAVWYMRGISESTSLCKVMCLYFTKAKVVPCSTLFWCLQTNVLLTFVFYVNGKWLNWQMSANIFCQFEYVLSRWHVGSGMLVLVKESLWEAELGSDLGQGCKPELFSWASCYCSAFFKGISRMVRWLEKIQSKMF